MPSWWSYLLLLPHIPLPLLHALRIPITADSCTSSPSSDACIGVYESPHTLCFGEQARIKNLRPWRSRVHGWGLVANEPIEANQFVIEYTGEIVRNMISDRREKAYDASGLGSCYMFRLDEERVVDATCKVCLRVRDYVFCGVWCRVSGVAEPLHLWLCLVAAPGLQSRCVRVCIGRSVTPCMHVCCGRGGGVCRGVFVRA